MIQSASRSSGRGIGPNDKEISSANAAKAEALARAQKAEARAEAADSELSRTAALLGAAQKSTEGARTETRELHKRVEDVLSEAGQLCGQLAALKRN